jgi:hypothetical protein
MSYSQLLNGQGELTYPKLATHQVRLFAGAAESDKNLTAALLQNLTERIQALEGYVLALQETYQILDAQGNPVRLVVPQPPG